MVSKENKKLIFGIILAALVFLSYQVIASYMTNPVDSSLKYPNPGHYPGEIGPGTFNASNSANPYWDFPGRGYFDYLEVFDTGYNPDFLVRGNAEIQGNTTLGNDSSDKTTIIGDLCLGGVCHSSWPSGGGTTYWNQSSTYLYPNNINWNVGIGTTSPAAKLEVNGGMYLYGSGDVNGDGSVTVVDSFMIAKWLAGTETLTKEEYARADINGDGKVNELDVELINSYIVGKITLDEARHSVGKRISDSTISITYDGNVGIGTTSPSEKLEVNGNAKIEGDLNVSGTIERTGYVKGDCNGDGVINIKDADLLFDYITSPESYTLYGDGDINCDGNINIGDAVLLENIIRNGAEYLNASCLTFDSISLITFSKIEGDLSVTGGIVVGNPTGGNKGPGTINAEKIYVNGNEISSVEGLNRSEILDMLYFGSGKDGDVVITSDTTVSRDMEYRNLTVKSGATLNPNGWRIFVSDTLTIEEGGKISRDGNDGGNAASCPGWGVCWRCPGSGGAPLQAHTVGGSGGGASGSCGNAGDGESGEAGGNGGNGGDAENGARSGGNGGAGGNKIINYLPSPFMSFLSLPVEIAETGGAGGGGGAGYTSASGRSAGGGGGSGGGVIHIFAKNIILNGNITAKGGKGGNGVCGCSCGSCSHLYYAAGGGGGGGGGFILLVYKTKTGSGTIDVSGGEGGKGCTDYYGDVGEDGEDGKAGYIKEFQITY